MEKLLEIIDLQLVWDNLPFILGGLSYTLSISLYSFILSLIIGTIIAFIRIFEIPVLNIIANFYVSFFRGVPALVVLFFLYFGLPFIDILLTAYQASIIGFTLTASAYACEIMRSSILAIDRGQWEAGMSLGLPIKALIKLIVLPQSIRLAIPGLSNILLDLVKGSSLTAMITVSDVFQRAKIVGGSNHNFLTMYLLVALIYWVICLFYEQFQNYLEKKLNLQASPIKFTSIL